MPSSQSPSQAPIWVVDPENFLPELLAEAARIIDTGGVLIYPTETFYGLGGKPLEARTVERIYRIKGRQFAKPLPLIASDRGAAEKAVSEWPEAAKKLTAVFWPGPLTLVLPAAPNLPAVLHAGTGKVALRVSPHPVAHHLAAAAGGLLVSTSANRAGGPAPASPRAIPRDLLFDTDGMIDWGDLSGGLPSTIVDVSQGRPKLVRSGRLEWGQIQRVLGSAFFGD